MYESEWSQVLLAKANLHGKLELLTAAWETVLGYGRQENHWQDARQADVLEQTCSGCRGDPRRA